jgi:antitoxin PrlF
MIRAKASEAACPHQVGQPCVGAKRPPRPVVSDASARYYAVARVLPRQEPTVETSTLTSKGQVTIPSEVRKRLGLHSGDPVGFVVGGDTVRLVRRESRIEAAFGLIKSEASLSVEDMERVIRDRAGA